MSIRAVLFDLDNTLTHRDQSVQAYSHYLNQYYAARLSHTATNHISQIVRRIDNGGYPKKELLTHPSIAASVGYALQQELAWRDCPELAELSQFWFENFGRFAVAMPGAKALLQQLKQQGFRLGVISNGGQQTRINILQGLGFSHYFEVIHSSELLGISKPKPEIFLHTAQALNLAPEQCLFVGDHPINDIQGALSAGMQALWLAGFHPTVQDLSYHQIDDLAQVWQHLTQQRP